MRTPRRLVALLALSAALTTAALTTAGCVPSGSAPGGDASGSAASGSPSTGTGGDASQARADLDALSVAAPRSMAGYSRDRFPHWTQQGNGCDTREYVLKRAGTAVHTTTSCHVTSGKWLSPYDDKTVTDAGKLDIDHMVPLANAWRSGANTWTDDKRSQFANDITRPQLFAVSLTVNRAKGDQDPSQWKPPYHGYWCRYAENWITVKRYWKLTVTTAEKQALVDMLGTCQ